MMILDTRSRNEFGPISSNGLRDSGDLNAKAIQARLRALDRMSDRKSKVDSAMQASFELMPVHLQGHQRNVGTQMDGVQLIKQDFPDMKAYKQWTTEVIDPYMKVVETYSLPCNILT